MRPMKVRGGQDPIFKRPKTHSKKLLHHIKSLESLQLPNIYSKSLKLKAVQVSLESSNDIRKELCKVITFVKDKPSVLQSQIYTMLPEEVKGVMNSTQVHREIIALVNKIFNSCDITLRQKDVLLMEGKKSQAKYVLINNGNYKPKSLCCQQTIVLKCIDRFGIQEQKKMVKKVHLLCLGCNKIILRFIQKEGVSESQMDKKRKLLDFALHIASGRYKKHKLQQDPFNNSLIHVKSRVSQHMSRGLQSLG